MTQLTITNLGPGIKAINNSDRRPITLKPGDKRSLDTDPFTASLLLKDAASKYPKFDIHISVDERQAMEEALASARFKPPGKQGFGNAVAQQQEPPKTEKRFVTDPKTVDDGFEQPKDEEPPSRAKQRKRRPRSE